MRQTLQSDATIIIIIATVAAPRSIANKTARETSKRHLGGIEVTRILIVNYGIKYIIWLCAFRGTHRGMFSEIGSFR